MARWKARVHPQQSDVASTSGRAAGVLEVVMTVADLIPPKFRASVYTRRISRFRFQRWMLSVGIDLCNKLVAPFASANCSVEDWFMSPADGVWGFDLSCKAFCLCSPTCDLRTPQVTWCDSPGCPARRKNVLPVPRGATQLARR